MMMSKLWRFNECEIDPIGLNDSVSVILKIFARHTLTSLSDNTERAEMVELVCRNVMAI